MELSSFFNSIAGDRKYKAEDWAAYFSALIGNGVFPLPSTGLQVVQGAGMTVTVKAGKAWINGYFYQSTADLPVQLATADGTLKRLDRVVLRWDLTARTIRAAVKSSALSSAPTAPTLQRDADAWELCLADVLVSAGVTTVTQAAITDRRLNTALCGVVAGLVNTIDTAAFGAQLDAWLAQYQTDSTAAFNTWFESVRDQLEQNMMGRWSRVVLSTSEPDGMLTGDVWYGVKQ